MNMDANRMRKLDFKVKSVCLGVTALAYVIALAIYLFGNDISVSTQVYCISSIIILHFIFQSVMAGAYFDEMPKRGISFHIKVLAVMLVMVGIFACIPAAEPKVYISPVEFAVMMVLTKLPLLLDAIVCNAYIERCREKGIAAKNVKRVSNIFLIALSAVVVAAAYFIFK